jgi:glycerol-3-phosphate acyltransferase PlsY
LIIARRKGVDIYAEGSGNPGATNVGRVIGKKEARIVLVLDAAKGALPSAAARWILGDEDAWVAATGVAAALGHCFPIWHRFRGGKGAATAAGVLLATTPIAGLFAIATYLGAKKITQRTSVGSLLGALVGAVIVLGLEGWGAPLSQMALAIAGLVWLRHADNLVRLARGEEPPS